MINCIVVGLGRIGMELSSDPYREKPCTHTESILHNPHTRIVAGIDSNPKKRIIFKRKAISPAYPTWEEFTRHHNLPDVMFIATPPSTHSYYLKKTLQHSLPVAVVEKPISDNYNEAIKLCKDFRNAKTRVIVNHGRRFAEDYLYVKKIIDTKKYGNLLSLNARLYTGHNPNFRSLLHDGTHLIDIASFLTKVSSGTKIPTQTTIKNLKNIPSHSKDRSLRFFISMNNIPCMFEIGGGKKFFHFELNLYFEHGKIDIGNDVFQEWASGPSKLFKGFITLNLKNKKFPQTKCFSNMIKHVVSLYNNPNLQSLSSLQDGLFAFKVINQLKNCKLLSSQNC